MSLGYGRKAAGYVGGLESEEIAPVGVDAYPLRTSDAMYQAAGVSIEATGTKYRLATSQDHHAIDTAGFELVT